MDIIKKLITLLLALIFTAYPVTVFAEGGNGLEHLEKKDYYKKIIEREIDYIKKLQLKNGAIGMFALGPGSYPGMEFPVVDGISPEEYMKWPSVKVVPYFTDSAVMGIIKGCEALGITDGREVVLKYINWYISHMNTKESDLNGVAGTVYDYFIFQSNDGRIVEVTLHDAYASQYPTDNPHDYDSTDSYAAMFLEILYEYTRVFDNNFLKDKKDIVDTLVDVIMATYVPAIDLTYAKPNYAVVYLMDNCEVFRGFEAAAKIYGEYLADKEKEEYCTTYAQKVKNAILTTMWDDKNSCFRAAVFTNGKPTADINLLEFYPQASCQLFPAIFGVLEPDDTRAVTVYERFKADFIQEGVSGRDWSVYDLEGLVYPWCILAYASLEMGDYRITQRHIKAMNAKFIRTGHSYPYYNAEAGWILLVCAELYNLAEGEPEESLPEETTAEESVISDISGDASSLPEVSAPISKKGISPWIYAGIGISAAAIAAVAAGIIGKNKRKKG